MPGPNNISIIIVVNGHPVTVEHAPVHQPLRELANKALKDSGNSGQPLDGWEMRDANGNVLDLSKNLQDYGLSNGAQLFLNLKAGVGG